MGFSADHPLVNYIIDNFDRGVKTCGTEFIYIRSALAKSGLSDIKLLYQDIMNEIHNVIRELLIHCASPDYASLRPPLSS